MKGKTRTRVVTAAVLLTAAAALAGCTHPPSTPGVTTTTTAGIGTVTVAFAERVAPGNGTVTSSPPGINCEPPALSAPGCSATFTAGTVVTLSAVGATDLVAFRGWAGSCTGTATTCSFTVSPAAATVSAEFAGPVPLCVVVDPTSTGAGSVAVAPLASTVTATFCNSGQFVAVGTQVTLTAAPAAGSLVVFTGWTGVCAGVTSTTCTFEVTDPDFIGAGITASARFGGPGRLTVNVTGPGVGTVTVNGSDSCTSGQSCTFLYRAGTTLSLVATPGGSAVGFSGWGGSCSGTLPTCTLTAPEFSPSGASTLTVNAGFPIVP